MDIEFRKYVNMEITQKVPDYLAALRSDFEENPEYADAFSFLFLNGYPIKKMIFEDLTITDIGSSVLNKPMPYDNTSVFPLKKIGQMPDFIKNNSTSNKSFFNTFLHKHEFDVLEDANNFRNSQAYFLIDKKRFKKQMDTYFLKSFPDYKKCDKANIFIKNISDIFTLYYDTRTGQLTNEYIQHYRFPLFTLEINSMPTTFLFETGANDLLFMIGGPFDYFLFHYNSYFTDEVGNCRHSFLNDEPIVVHNKFTEKYEVRNSEDLTLRVNKYIETSLELYLHYFRIFEKWLIGVLKEISETTHK
ncbi:MAG: hypothetical protein SFU21_04755 [Flavihumibacter sp.]|nr:hypothetical protein [Flavihumibacter sp.]